MPVIVTCRLDSEDSFEQMMVLDIGAKEALTTIQQFVDEFADDNGEYEVVAGQFVHSDEVNMGAFEVTEVDHGVAGFITDLVGDNFGTGILDVIFE